MLKKIKFKNKIFSKKELKHVIHEAFTNYGISRSSLLADDKLRFAYFWAPKSLSDIQNPSVFKTVDDIVDVMQKIYNNSMSIQNIEAVANQLFELKPFTQSYFKINLRIGNAQIDSKIVLLPTGKIGL